MNIKESDYNELQGWFTRVMVKDKIPIWESKKIIGYKDTTRYLNANELFIFSKLYGFVKDNQGICRAQEDYFQAWSGTDRKTVYNALKLFESNNFIKVKRFFDKNSNKTRNQYFINPAAFSMQDDSDFIVKNDSTTVILPFQLELPLKSYENIIYSIIHNYSKDGESVCTASLRYFTEWCNGASSKTVKRAFDKLLELNLIQKENNPDSPSGFIYWSTYSRTNPDSLNGQISPSVQLKESDKIPHQSGQNSPLQQTKFPIGMDKIPHLNTSINLSEKEVVVSKATATDFFTKINKAFENTSFSKLPSDKSFVTKFSNFLENKNIDGEKLKSYVQNTIERFSLKKKQDIGLLIVMLISESDYSVFSKKYDEALNKQKNELENIKKRTVVCPVCNNKFLRASGYGCCSCCGLQEDELEDSSRITELKEWMKLSDEEKAERERLNQEQLENMFSMFKPKNPAPESNLDRLA